MKERYQIYRSQNKSYKIFDAIAPSYNLLNHLLSFGLDIYWRRKLLSHLCDQKKIDALDVACGTGDLSLLLLQDPKISNVVGIDLSEKMIEVGRKKVEQKKYRKPISLEVGDGQQIPYPDRSFGLVTIAFGIRNFSDLDKSLAEIHRVLRPNGRLLIMEFSTPSNKFMKKIYFFYLRKILPLIGGLISRNMSAYKYLNDTIETFPYGQKFIELINNAQFKNTSFKSYTGGIVTIYRGDR